MFESPKQRNSISAGNCIMTGFVSLFIGYFVNNVIESQNDRFAKFIESGRYSNLYPESARISRLSDAAVVTILGPQGKLEIVCELGNNQSQPPCITKK